MVDAHDWAPSDSLPALLVWGPQMPALPKLPSGLHSAERADSSKDQFAKPEATPLVGRGGRAIGVGSRRVCGGPIAAPEGISRRPGQARPEPAPRLPDLPSGAFRSAPRPALTTAERLMRCSHDGFLRKVCEFLEPDLRTATRPQRMFGRVGQSPAGQGVPFMSLLYRQPSGYPAGPAGPLSSLAHALPQAKLRAPHAR